MSSPFAPLAPGEELIDAESFRRLHAGPAAHAGWRSVPVPVRVPPARRALPEIEGCRSRREVEQVAVRRAHAHAAAAAIFIARRGGIHAVCCEPAPPRVPGPIYWTSRPHALAAVLERVRPWRGAPAKDPLTTRILRSLGREGVREIALLPIPVQGRAAGFLYADAGEAPLAQPAFEGLAAIAERVARMWDRMIAEREYCATR